MSLFTQEKTRHITEWAPAKRRHKCVECGRVIEVGDWHNRYVLFEEEGKVTMRICGRCSDLRLVVQKHSAIEDENPYFGELLKTAADMGISWVTPHE